MHACMRVEKGKRFCSVDIIVCSFLLLSFVELSMQNWLDYLGHFSHVFEAMLKHLPLLLHDGFELYDRFCPVKPLSLLFPPKYPKIEASPSSSLSTMVLPSFLSGLTRLLGGRRGRKERMGGGFQSFFPIGIMLY